MGGLFNFAAVGAVVGIIAGGWNYIKGMGWKLAQTLVQRVSFHRTTFLHDAVVNRLIEVCKQPRYYDRIYAGALEYLRDYGRNGVVPYEEYGNGSLLLWYGRAPIWLSRGVKSKNNKDTDGASADDDKLSITFIRGTFDIDAFIIDATKSFNKASWDSSDEQQGRIKRFFINYCPAIEENSEGTASPSFTNSVLPWYYHKRYRLIGTTPDKIGGRPDETSSALDHLVFPSHIMQLIDEIKLWRHSRDWYNSRGIPWKRGWLLYGVPGTGKTALARAFAEDLDMPIFVYRLAELNNNEFMKAWHRMLAAAPCIALIEDIDGVFNGRDNISQGQYSFGMPTMGPRRKSNDKRNGYVDDHADDDFHDMGGKLTFDTFINVLDGIRRNDGVFTIITTNNLDTIDEAIGRPVRNSDGTMNFISTRPGRIDKAVELTYMTNEDKLRLAARILGDYPAVMEEVRQFVEDNSGLQETPAQFQERCTQLALRAFWDEKNTKKLLQDESPFVGQHQQKEPFGVLQPTEYVNTKVSESYRMREAQVTGIDFANQAKPQKGQMNFAREEPVN